MTNQHNTGPTQYDDDGMVVRLSDETIGNMERRFVEMANGKAAITRRMLLAFMGQTKEEIVATIREDEAAAEALVTFAEQCGDFLRWWRSFNEVMQGSHARLLEILDEAAGDNTPAH